MDVLEEGLGDVFNADSQLVSRPKRSLMNDAWPVETGALKMWREDS